MSEALPRSVSEYRAQTRARERKLGAFYFILQDSSELDKLENVRIRLSDASVQDWPLAISEPARAEFDALTPQQVNLGLKFRRYRSVLRESPLGIIVDALINTVLTTRPRRRQFMRTVSRRLRADRPEDEDTG